MLEKFKAQIRQCEYRYTIHQQERKQRQEQLKLFQEGQKDIDWHKLDSLARLRFRLENSGLGEAIREPTTNFSLTEDIPKINILERVLGENDLTGISFLHTGSVGLLFQVHQGFLKALARDLWLPQDCYSPTTTF